MTIRILNDYAVIQDPQMGQLRAIFPDLKEAVIKGERFAAVPYNMDSALILRNLGFSIPSPIRTQYNWPGRYTPRWYQIEMGEFYSFYPSRAYNHSEMRTGKTLGTLWAMDYLKSLKKINRTLIVAPLSTIFDVWESNIFESFPHLTYTVLHGSRETRLKRLKEKHDVYIINHHGIGIIEKELAHRPDINMCINDEIAVMRNARGTTLFQPMNRVLNLQNIVRNCWALTGSPTPNEPTDAYGQCKLITPGNYQGSFTSFKQLTMLRLNKFKWVPRKNCEQIVNQVLRPVIRFERSVCTDMEPCYIDRKAELSADQQKAYKDLIRQAKADVSGKVVTAVNAAALLTKLTQVACGIVLDAEGNAVKMDYGPRLKVLEELIEENNEKVVVFVPFTGVLDDLTIQLRKKWSVEYIDGSVSVGKRNDILKRFRQLKDPHVLICHPGTMAHGLDLTTASLAIWYAPYTKSEYYHQACARIDGSKQKVKMDIAHIYATPEERRIYAAVKGKLRLQDAVLDLSKEWRG